MFVLKKQLKIQFRPYLVQGSITLLLHQDDALLEHFDPLRERAGSE